jgi:hypothetical protein
MLMQGIVAKNKNNEIERKERFRKETREEE